MYKQYSADRMIANFRQYWGDADTQVDAFAIYLHRSQQLSLKFCSPTISTHQISSTEFDVLAALRNTAPPHVLTPTELQRSMLITSGGLTKVLYQLEARGFISRSVQEHDKRSKLVHLTEMGKDIIEQGMEEVHKTDREMLESALSQNELETLIELMGKVTREFEKRDGQFTDE